MQTPQSKPCAKTLARELHIYDIGVSPKKGFHRYRVEITQLFLGKLRTLRKFEVHENQVERLVLKYSREFGVPGVNVFRHAIAAENAE